MYRLQITRKWYPFYFHLYTERDAKCTRDESFFRSWWTSCPNEISTIASDDMEAITKPGDSLVSINSFAWPSRKSHTGKASEISKHVCVHRNPNFIMLAFEARSLEALLPMQTRKETGVSMPTSPRFWSASPENCMPGKASESIWNRRHTPSIPPPSIFVFRCFPGRDFANTRPPSNCTHW